MFLRGREDLWQLSQHIGDTVPQPAHTSQIKARSVERAMGASHGITGWACQAAGDAAHLARLWSARRAVHRDLVGAVQGRSLNSSVKGFKGRPEEEGGRARSTACVPLSPTPSSHTHLGWATPRLSPMIRMALTHMPSAGGGSRGVCARQLAVWRRWGRRLEPVAASGRGYVLGALCSFRIRIVWCDCVGVH